MFQSLFADVFAVKCVGKRDFFNAFVSIGDCFRNTFSESGNSEDPAAVADDIAVSIKFGSGMKNYCTGISGILQTGNDIALAV